MVAEYDHLTLDDDGLDTLDASTGALRWKLQAGDVIHASPSYADGLPTVARASAEGAARLTFACRRTARGGGVLFAP